GRRVRLVGSRHRAQGGRWRSSAREGERRPHLGGGGGGEEGGRGAARGQAGGWGGWAREGERRPHLGGGAGGDEGGRGPARLRAGRGCPGSTRRQRRQGGTPLRRPGRTGIARPSASQALLSRELESRAP